MGNAGDRMAAPPLVSVVVPTYERKRLLQETLDAILGQTYPNLEVIVVDNVSEDGTETFVKDLADPRIRYVRNANHGIIAANRNLGIRLARGKYVALCDDDDLWLPTKVERQAAVMEARPAVGLSYCNAVVFNETGVIDRSLVKWRVFRGHYGRLVYRNFIPSSSVMLRKEVVDAHGGFDESGDLAPYEDYELWLRVARAHELAYVDEPLLRYRVHGSNWAGRYGNRQRIVIKVLRSVQRKAGSRDLRISIAILLRRLKAALSP